MSRRGEVSVRGPHSCFVCPHACNFRYRWWCPTCVPLSLWTEAALSPRGSEKKFASAGNKQTRDTSEASSLVLQETQGHGGTLSGVNVSHRRTNAHPSCMLCIYNSSIAFFMSFRNGNYTIKSDSQGSDQYHFGFNPRFQSAQSITPDAWVVSSRRWSRLFLSPGAGSPAERRQEERCCWCCCKVMWCERCGRERRFLSSPSPAPLMWDLHQRERVTHRADAADPRASDPEAAREPEIITQCELNVIFLRTSRWKLQSDTNKDPDS